LTLHDVVGWYNNNTNVYGAVATAQRVVILLANKHRLKHYPTGMWKRYQEGAKDKNRLA